MKIYLAGSCSSEDRTIMLNVKRWIRQYFPNDELYCPFELKIENAWDYTQEEWSRLVFQRDIKELDNSQLVIYISKGRMSSAGSNWEQGYAYARNIPIFVIQINDSPTSLMTYCGCDNFHVSGSNLDNIRANIQFIATNYNSPYLYNCPCSTILT